MSDGPLPPDWEATTDPSSGNTYYYNTKTNAVSWERPRGGPPPQELITTFSQRCFRSSRTPTRAAHRRPST